MLIGQALQDLAGLTADSYTLTGAGAVGAFGIPFQYLGVPQAGHPILRYTFAETVSFPANLFDSVATAANVATASTIFDVANNAINFATMTFSAGVTQAIFSGSAQIFAAGDVLTVVPRTTDATLANLSGLLAGTS